MYVYTPTLSFFEVSYEKVSIPRSPNVPLRRALWSLLDGIWGVLRGSWGVLLNGTYFGPQSM